MKQKIEGKINGQKYRQFQKDLHNNLYVSWRGNGVWEMRDFIVG